MISEAVRTRIVARGGIPLKCANGEYLFTSDQFHYWRAEFRDVDITGEVVELSRWLARNPSKRPEKNQCRWVIGGWLKKKHKGGR